MILFTQRYMLCHDVTTTASEHNQFADQCSQAIGFSRTTHGYVYGEKLVAADCTAPTPPDNRNKSLKKDGY